MHTIPPRGHATDGNYLNYRKETLPVYIFLSGLLLTLAHLSYVLEPCIIIYEDKYSSARVLASKIRVLASNMQDPSFCRKAERI